MTPPRRLCAVALVIALACRPVLSGPAVPALAAADAGGTATFQEPMRSSVPALPPRYALRGEDSLVRAYEFILDSRFDQVDAELRRACGPAPPEACNVLEATALWWRIQLDPENRALDAAFSAAVERAIRTAEAWTDREPQDAEAWFYLGGAYGARVQWRVLRGEKLSAARDGKQIKEAMERAVALEPGLDDAYFGLGMYKYYADVAPAAARFLRFLLLLPGGDRKEGLRQMLRARSRGRLVQGEADFQLHVIYLWYERQTERAIELLRALQRVGSSSGKTSSWTTHSPRPLNCAAKPRPLPLRKTSPPAGKSEEHPADVRRGPTDFCRRSVPRPQGPSHALTAPLAPGEPHHDHRRYRCFQPEGRGLRPGRSRPLPRHQRSTPGTRLPALRDP
jgi:hypothetical protein